MAEIETETTPALSLSQIRLVSKAMAILRALDIAKQNPTLYPQKDGMVLYSQEFGCIALSKDQILAWTDVNSGGAEECKIAPDEFDILIRCCVFVSTITEPSGYKYYAFDR